MTVKVRRPFPSLVVSLLYLAAFGFASVISIRFTEINGAAFSAIRSKTAFICVSVVVALLLVVFVQLFYSRAEKLRYLPVASLIPLGIVLVVLLQEFKSANWFKSYGDSGWLAKTINEGKPFSRWLLGTTGLIDIFGLLNAFVFSMSAQQFVIVASAICMCAATIALQRGFGSKTYVLLPLTTPIWIAFSLGYDEYYPFIVGVFVLIALWICVRPDADFSYLKIGLIGTVPAIYVGFVPLALFALVKILRKAKSVKEFAGGFALSVLAYLSALEIGWPEGHSSYLVKLSEDMLLGDTREIHGYQGSSLSSKSPFFSLRSAFSFFHIRDMLFNAFFASGIVAFLLLITVFVYSREKQRGDLLAFKRSYRPTLAVAFVIWNAVYLLFMIPKLGPTSDIDLFFATNFVFAIWCGVLLEKIFDYRQLSIRVRANFMSAVVALNGPIVSSLVIYGIQR